METVEIRRLNRSILEEIKSAIVSGINPKKIVLFGSYAYGDPDDASDLDLLVIVDNLRGSRREARLKIRKLIRRYLIPKDIIVVTEKDVKDWQNVSSAFITSVMKKGRVIYEREN